jgi:predicted DNA-binding transcriptional regulator AlpA
MQMKLIDEKELAAKLGVKPSWVKERTRRRCPESQRIPCIRLGRYVRFNEAVVEAWLENGCKPLSSKVKSFPSVAHVT